MGLQHHRPRRVLLSRDHRRRLRPKSSSVELARLARATAVAASDTEWIRVPATRARWRLRRIDPAFGFQRHPPRPGRWNRSGERVGASFYPRAEVGLEDENGVATP